MSCRGQDAAGSLYANIVAKRSLQRVVVCRCKKSPRRKRGERNGETRNNCGCGRFQDRTICHSARTALAQRVERDRGECISRGPRRTSSLQFGPRRTQVTGLYSSIGSLSPNVFGRSFARLSIPMKLAYLSSRSFLLPPPLSLSLSIGWPL